MKTFKREDLDSKKRIRYQGYNFAQLTYRHKSVDFRNFVFFKITNPKTTAKCKDFWSYDCEE